MNTSELSSLPGPAAAYLRLSFPEPPQDRPYVILNMVSSADGKATAGATESALSSATDKLVLQALRVHADAILNGAGTARLTGVDPSIRDERLRRLRRGAIGKKDAPLQALVTSRADLPPSAPFLRRPGVRLVIFVAGAAEPANVEALKATGRPVEEVAAGPAGIDEMLRRLHGSYGVRLLLVEGGPSLNASLFHAGVIDEFFLTLAPHIVGGRDTITLVEGEAFTAEAMPALELLSAIPNAETSEVYLHWRVRRPAARS